MVTVKYLGILAGEAGKAEEAFKIEELGSPFLTFIMWKYPEFRKLSFVVALNGEITHGDMEVKEGDELTLIPPPPGG